MTDPAPYETAAEVATDRVRWSAALLTRLVQRARREGWLPGATRAPDELPDADALRAQIDGRIAVTVRAVGRVPMQWLAARLGLGSRELDLLWMLATIELSPAVTRLAQAFGAAERSDLTMQIAQQLVAVSRRELDELHELGLLEMSCDPRLAVHQRWIRASDRVVELARGELALELTLARACELVARDDLAAQRSDVPAELATALERGVGPVVIAVGPEGCGRTTLLARAAGGHGFGTLRVNLRELPPDAEARARALRGVARECRLFDVIPLLRELDALGEDAAQVVERELVTWFPGPVLVTATRDRRWRGTRPVVTHRVGPAPASARLQIWKTAMPGADDGVVEAAASRYTATPGTILAAATHAVLRAGTPARVTIDDVHQGLRGHLDDQLGDLANRVVCTQAWSDIVLPVDQFEQIAELVARMQHRSHVLDTWGFADKVGRGLGLVALLSGPPGTGKTMVAGLIARELGLDLYQVDLSRVVSKYIGETEQRLARVFDAAESGHALLLFDEADALFAKRSEVRSSNDRYANLEVTYLLQRIEQFRGISLLTTNHETAIDEAFRRRLAFHVRFPVPDEDHRDQLWRAMIPARAEVTELDFSRLAHGFAMTGGYIKNAAVRAAYLAAAEASPITTEHLWRAARAEAEAMGQLA